MQINGITSVARNHQCAVHMDGARLFNAVHATGVEPARMVQDCDTVSICISKGLGAPVGGVLVGSEEMISTGTPMAENVGRWDEAGRYLGGCRLVCT